MEDTRPSPEELLTRMKQNEVDRNTGKLKIFLGYAAGVGKTYAMLEAAQQAKSLGTDVVVGYIEQHPRPETTALLEGLDRIPAREISYKGKIFKELDIDAIIKRNPELVLIDELAHTNVPTMRHIKRFGDVEELLARGINVYTTVNIQHIESLHDLVEEITGVKVREHIPDYIIDQAAHIKLVDIEPDELIERLNQGKIYHPKQAEKALKLFFRKENLVALREVALRRAADTIFHHKTQQKKSVDPCIHVEEHILVGISSSPTNAKVIRTAARLAHALHGKFTALYVQRIDKNESNTAYPQRLQQHIKLTEQLGGHVVIVQENDVAEAIANYAQISGVTELVIGRTAMKKKWRGPYSKIGDKINDYMPNLSIHIVPDEENEPIRFSGVMPQIQLEWLDILKTVIVFGCVSLIGLFFFANGLKESNIITIYILGVLIIATWTNGWIMSIISSLMAVLTFNFLFTEPRFSFEAYRPDYLMTFIIMFLSGFITSSLTRKVKAQAVAAVRKSYRMEVLLETNRKLQHAKSVNEIINEGMSQIIKLVERPAVFFKIDNSLIVNSVFFKTNSMTDLENKEIATLFDNASERGVVTWAASNLHIAGMTTDIFPEAQAYYLPIVSGGDVKGIIGIALSKEYPLPEFERHILHAIINDFSFAIDKWYLQKINQEVAREAELEQMRADLLRAISHDLRTPLTSISGNADILLTNGERINNREKEQLYQDIYNNSKWLVQMVENLLAVSRLEDGHFALEMQPELVEDVIQEALQHSVPLNNTHKISYHIVPELLFAQMDARLIIQVIINIIDNALTYTPSGSEITLKVVEGHNDINFSIIDNGPGIEDSLKTKLFNPFITGKEQRTDSRRGLGLGLALCQTILKLHGSELTVMDNDPTGTIFSFPLKKGAINFNE